MKKISAVITIAILYVLAGVALPSQADMRLKLSATTETVFSGSTVVFSVTGNVLERSAYDWKNFKYEVVGKPSGDYASSNLADHDYCKGEELTLGTGYKTCTVKLSGQRTVISAPVYGSVNSSNFLVNSPLSIKAGYLGNRNLAMRAWLDSNNNGKIDPYEPASQRSSLTILDISELGSYLKFQVDPPVIWDYKLSAHILTNETVGLGNYSVGMLDPSKLAIQVTSCEGIDCNRQVLASTWNAHPSLNRYDFETEFNFYRDSTYVVRLFYNPKDLPDASRSFLLGSKSFTLGERTVFGASTNINAPYGETASNEHSRIASDLQTVQHFLEGPASSTVFSYAAELYGINGEPVVGKDVYFSIDVSNYGSHSGLWIDGIKFQASQTDELNIKRKTDNKGQVVLDFYSPRALESSIGIELIADGMRGKDIAAEALEQKAYFAQGDSKVLNLSLIKDFASGGDPLKARAYVTNLDNKYSEDLDAPISFSSNENLELSASLIDGRSYQELEIRVSPLAERSGSAKLYVKTLSKGLLVTRMATISWADYGNLLTGKLDKFTPQVENISLSIDQTLTAGQVAKGFLRLNSNLGVLGKKDVSITYISQKKTITKKAKSDLKGQIPISFKATEPGITRVEVTSLDSGLTKNFFILTDVKADVKFVKDHYVVKLRNAEYGHLNINHEKSANYVVREKVESRNIWISKEYSGTLSVSIFGIRMANFKIL